MKNLIAALQKSKRRATNQRDNWKRRAMAYEAAIRETLAENGHLADGDDCTLAKLKRALADAMDDCENQNQKG